MTKLTVKSNAYLIASRIPQGRLVESRGVDDMMQNHTSIQWTNRIDESHHKSNRWIESTNRIPKRPVDSLMGRQDRSKRAEDPLKTAQKPPKTLQRGPKSPQERPKIPTRRPKNLPKSHLGTVLERSRAVLGGLQGQWSGDRSPGTGRVPPTRTASQAQTPKPQRRHLM